jgi:hypothetical protein
VAAVESARLAAVVARFALCGSLAACGSGAGQRPLPAGPAHPLPAHWDRFRHVPGVVDLAGPHGDGSFTVAAAGRLLVLRPPGTLAPFARGPGGYATAIGPEPYLATTTTAVPVAGTHCSFGTGTVFALQPSARPGVIRIGTTGQARPFASLARVGTPDGIAFDTTGRFGHRLLVTARGQGHTTVLAVDCSGGMRVITRRAPSMEGGMTVAPASFGRYAGDLIAPNEGTGRVYAVAPDGHVSTLVESGLPHGGDIGVESAGFVPPGFTSGDAAYLADRYSRGNRHPGTNSILRLPGAELARAGVRPGDLLVATEGSALTIAVRCAAGCTVREIAAGPAISHAEGHIVFSGPAG